MDRPEAIRILLVEDNPGDARLRSAFVVAELALHELHGAADGGERVPDLVGEPHRHPPHRRQRLAAAHLGLEPAPVSTQIVQRDRHAAFLAAIAVMGGSLERFATEVRNLQHTEIGEVQEPFRGGQKGSSAMPHKRNPITSERIVGLCRLLRGYALAGFEDQALWHERDISHSSVERVALPGATTLLHYMLVRFAALVDGLVVRPERMRENLGRSRGVVFSGTILLELARRGHVARGREMGGAAAVVVIFGVENALVPAANRFMNVSPDKDTGADRVRIPTDGQPRKTRVDPKEHPRANTFRRRDVGARDDEISSVHLGK